MVAAALIFLVVARSPLRSRARRRAAEADGNPARAVRARNQADARPRPRRERQCPIAWTTKLMTALIVLEHVHHLGTIFTQPDYYAASTDSQIGLAAGRSDDRP